MYVRHVYTVKASFDKIPNKNCLKAKAWDVVRVVA